MYAFVDGQGEMVGQPAVIDSRAGAGLRLPGLRPRQGGADDQLPARVAGSAAGAELADRRRRWSGAGVATLKLNVAQPVGTMSCARSVLYTPTGAGPPEYAMVWQDTSGSWLSVYYGPQTNMVKSFPFASSTDFGGAGSAARGWSGLAAFGNDFGVLFARAALGRAVAHRPGGQPPRGHAGAAVAPGRHRRPSHPSPRPVC